MRSEIWRLGIWMAEPHRVSRRLYWLGDNGVRGRPIMYSPEVRERAVWMVSEHRGEHRSEWAAICSIASKFWSSPRWLDTSTKSAFGVREWTQRVGKEFCWEGVDRDGSSRMSSNVDAVEIVRSSGRPVRQVANELGIYDSTLGNWVRQDGINRGEREGLTSGERERTRRGRSRSSRLQLR